MTETSFHNEISRSLGRLEGKIEEGFAALQKETAKITATLNDHEKRIRSIEGDIAHAKGVVAIIGGIAGIIASATLNFIKKIWG
jgi:hypothetical protein